ncbi:hydrogenase expression/formation protein HypE [Marinobacterium weihaiense]|uniref:Hydrogenase expression/formation protein HypE n=1 Tax=Marinobacterium weihaiense TaxID=2851016 RepID=A0ABS6M7Y0_9GAMM|nr:hydrogenase expression/formation protein HypE [Marinobacterium weihaiense]MBV0931892.1 hydrogenase expression/formation protein HypE [Marinobacterium weihaiense]
MSESDTVPCITLAQGAGGAAMRQLVETLFAEAFDNPYLAKMEDQARLDLSALQAVGDRLAFATDSYVIQPLEFPGGDIGRLAVNGTVNDLAVGGARPLFLSCAFIIEEGLPLPLLQRIVRSMADAAREAGVKIVTGDTKVVPRGQADGLFINTSGVGVIPKGCELAATRCRPGDAVLVSGTLGDHGAAILNARGELGLESQWSSDCQPLHGLVEQMLARCSQVRALRDATRGGVAAVLHEFAQASACSMRLFEAALPVRPEVRGVCELLGLDALHFANEGKLVAVVAAEQAQALLAAMQAHPAGHEACIIGEVLAGPAGQVQILTGMGSERLLDLPTGELLPRIC